MYQHEAVAAVMQDNGGYATLKHLYANAPHVEGIEWETNTPNASIRRIVQRKEKFVKLRPGLWALASHREELPEHLHPEPASTSASRTSPPSRSVATECCTPAGRSTRTTTGSRESGPTARTPPRTKPSVSTASVPSAGRSPAHTVERHRGQVCRTLCRHPRRGRPVGHPRRHGLGRPRKPRTPRVGVRPVHEDARVQGRRTGHRCKEGRRARYIEDLFGLRCRGREPARRARAVRL
jgi:hypothetical protein